MSTSEPLSRAVVTGRPTPPAVGAAALIAALLRPAERRWSALIVLAALCGMMFFYGLDVGELYRTESLRAIIGRGFLESGNWLVPTLYGQPLLTKPPGMYAAIAAASWPFGEVTEWTARLPSALAATAVVFLFYWYAGRQLGRLGGLVAAAVTPCTFLWLEKASAAEIDMLQVAWVSAALVFFFRATEGESPPRRAWGWWLAALLCVAGGGLTKWTAGVFFYAAAVPFLLWRRQLRLLVSPQHLLAALAGAGICLAWVAAVVQQVGWETFWSSVWAEALPRLSHKHHLGDNQLLESLAHPFKLLLVNLPWSGFALLTLTPGFLACWDERGRRLVQAFHCWAWPNIFVWSVLPDHATRHSFPLFPGITGLAALVWFAYLSGRLPQRWARLHTMYTLLALGLFGVLALAGGISGVVLLPANVWWLVLLVMMMALWCVQAGWRAHQAGRLGGLLASVVLTWLVLKVTMVNLYVPMRNAAREPRAKAAVLARTVPPGQPLYIFKVKNEGIMFYYGRPVVRLKDWDQLPLGSEPVYLVVDGQEWQEVQRRSDWRRTVEVHLRDEQGDPMVLLGVTRGEVPILQARAAGHLPHQ